MGVKRGTQLAKLIQCDIVGLGTTKYFSLEFRKTKWAIRPFLHCNFPGEQVMLMGLEDKIMGFGKSRKKIEVMAVIYSTPLCSY